MSPERVIDWMIGFCVFAFLAILGSTLAFYERDTARRATVETNGASITVTCPPTTTSEGGE